MIVIELLLLISILYLKISHPFEIGICQYNSINSVVII